MIDQDMIKAYGWHLKVQGAYVQQPNPAIVGLDDSNVIASNDAASLYPISGAHQNLGYDTLRDRVYDFGLVHPLINMITQVYKNKAANPQIITSAVAGFKNALNQTFKEYSTRRTVKNKKDALEFTLEYYPLLLKRVLSYSGNLEDIFSPVDDQTYYLLKSNLYPLLEAITWLSPQNYGYNKTIVEYIFFHDLYLKNKRQAYIFKEINSTKTKFELLNFEEGIKHFQTRILNSYGTLYDLHSTNLAYDVNLTKEALFQRRKIKDQMLVLEAIASQLSHLSEETKTFFYSPENNKFLSATQASKILEEINDSENREKRIKALTNIEFNITDNIKLYQELRITQLNIMQLGIKVAMNSGYGIFAMPTWVYSSSLIGNSFTNAGKIFGIKLFQAVSVNEIQKQERINKESNYG